MRTLGLSLRRALVSGTGSKGIPVLMSSMRGDLPGAAAVPEPYTEEETLTGRVRRRGIIRKGSAEGYKVDARIGPEGHAIGFRLDIDGDKAIPQCVADGPLGEALYMATGEHPETLIGVPATVAGILYHVRSPKGSWYRLKVDLIETTINGLDVILPAQEAETAELGLSA